MSDLQVYAPGSAMPPGNYYHENVVTALRARVAELEELVRRREEELEAYAWTISPAMAQAKIDELNATVERLTAERDAFIHGGVTEELLRKNDGFLKVGKGCVLVRDDDYRAMCGLRESLNGVQAKLATVTAEREDCLWTETKDGQYETACDQLHCFEDGGPYDNHIQYCGYCGKRLVERRWSEAGDGRG